MHVVATAVSAAAALTTVANFHSILNVSVKDIALYIIHALSDVFIGSSSCSAAARPTHAPLMWRILSRHYECAMRSKQRISPSKHVTLLGRRIEADNPDNRHWCFTMAVRIVQSQ